MSNEECSQYVRAKMKEGYHDLDKICEALIDTCLDKGSKDNMSAVIVSLPGAVFGEKITPPPSKQWTAYKNKRRLKKKKKNDINYKKIKKKKKKKDRST